ncbi:MAG: hypothetical protein ABI183_11595 [Polyangiaceae bacterium]
MAFVAIATIGCGPLTADAPATTSTCSNTAVTGGHEVDPWKELLVVDDAVMNDAAAKNETDGPLSFRFVMERLAGSTTDASTWTSTWMKSWAPSSLDIDGDLAHAPFRLIAVANRMDLSQPAGSGSAEGRLIFAATDGPGDDPASNALPLTVIVEFDLPGAPSNWAARWHALGAFDTFNAQYIDALTTLTSAFVSSENLGQIRINDGLEDPRGVLHEFHLANGSLVSTGLERTPTHTMDGTASLGDYLNANRDEILAGDYKLPQTFLAPEITLGSTWTLPGVDEQLRKAFAAGTCDGCHGGENPVIDGAFHVSPFRQGTAKVSRFLFDPDNRDDDELTRRAAILRNLACAN